MALSLLKKSRTRIIKSLNFLLPANISSFGVNDLIDEPLNVLTDQRRLASLEPARM